MSLGVDLAPFLFVYGGLAALAPAFALLERRNPAVRVALLIGGQLLCPIARAFRSLAP
jgi:hypothetical protein